MEKKKSSAINEKPLAGISVLLSASVPDELSHSVNAQDILSALILFTQRIIAAGGNIVFGGHPTITPLIRKAAASVNGGQDAVRLYQLHRFRDQAPKEIWDEQTFQEIQWMGDKKGEAPIESELAEMRDAMCGVSHAAVFIGGKTTGYHGGKPGIRDEYERFIKYRPQGPVYLLGMMNGEAGKIIEETEQTGQKEPNGLSEKELRIVHHEHNIDLIAPIVVHDIAKATRK